ncbi:MAG: EamA family transporter [Gemmatimonadetes bacterium]|uniref:EamA family transporter n=1 Tax=Candidatus Kutchimonas denitrificans TaxID=3056748 RepID=A0AAE5C9U2_9BACT|nr:EamA family transporter [Gemmatimonadota bacterium]NIR75841.1 EamA family transporter [Candidatus Kutchimonas denitrificans]NIS02008.1 EamA family transporter [Gemmatimonadota bacterium]NIT67812.1 EamA family transporter [Gemmatimonadota bacterium]NIU53799.1 EamA family transporter [Gemmatimonadota bacterium]
MAWVAYAIVCVVWGSTYLAIRIGVQHLPPALLGAFRFTAAGALLLTVALSFGHKLPHRVADWRTNLIVGVLLLGIANGLVIWAEQYVHSNVAAIFVVTVSLWLALFDALIPGSKGRPTPAQVVGLLVGFAGTLLLVGDDLKALREADWRGPIALTGASAVWALGSIYSQRRPTGSSPYTNSALQMLAGGAALWAAAAVRGEWDALAFSWAGFGAVAYLVLFGSIVGFTAYIYMLRHLPATTAGTYAYMNTVVAAALGWLVLSEPITTRTIVAMAIVLGSVVVVRRARRVQLRPAPQRVGKRKRAATDFPNARDRESAALIELTPVADPDLGSSD